MHTMTLIRSALFAGVALLVVAGTTGAAPEGESGQLRTEVAVAGQTLQVALGEPFELTSGEAKASAILELEDERRFAAGGVVFDYPWTYSFDHESKGRSKTWKVTSLDVAITVVRWKGMGAAAEDARDDVVESWLSTGFEGEKPAQIELATGGKTLEGMKAGHAKLGVQASVFAVADGDDCITIEVRGKRGSSDLDGLLAQLGKTLSFEATDGPGDRAPHLRFRLVVDGGSPRAIEADVPVRVTVGDGEVPLEVHGRLHRVFASAGVRFRYPGDYTEATSKDGSADVWTLEGPGSVALRVIRDEKEPDAEALAKRTADAVVGDYERYGHAVARRSAFEVDPEVDPEANARIGAFEIAFDDGASRRWIHLHAKKVAIVIELGVFAGNPAAAAEGERVLAGVIGSLELGTPSGSGARVKAPTKLFEKDPPVRSGEFEHHPPVGVTGKLVDGKIRLSWTESFDNKGIAIAAYEIWRKDGNDGTWTLREKVEAKRRRWVELGGTVFDLDYWFTVVSVARARDSAATIPEAIARQPSKPIGPIQVP